jgi:hypothetical protein
LASGKSSLPQNILLLLTALAPPQGLMEVGVRLLFGAPTRFLSPQSVFAYLLSNLRGSQ